jgi:hypothetical protein
MARTKNFTTKDMSLSIGTRIVCRIRISETTQMVRRPLGCYHPTTSKISLCLLGKAIDRQHISDDMVEKMVVHTLVHEVTHWAQYLMLDRAQWGKIGATLRAAGLRRRHDLLVERMATEVADLAVGGCE